MNESHEIIGTLMHTVKLLLLHRYVEDDDAEIKEQKEFVVQEVVACVEPDGKAVDVKKLQQVLMQHKSALERDYI